MTLLSLIQDFTRNHALSIPTSVVGGSNTTINQLFGLTKELIEDITEEASYTVNQREAVFTAVAAEDQGRIQTLADEGFKYIIPKTLYDRTNGLQLEGPLSPQEWQLIQANTSGAPNYYYRLRGDHFYLYPAPGASALPEIAFEYISSWIVYDNTNTLKAQFTADDDTCAIPEHIIRKGLAWKWKLVKGLPYDRDEQDYYSMLNNFIAKDGTKKPINVGCAEQFPQPAIFIPSGSWNV